MKFNKYSLLAVALSSGVVAVAGSSGSVPTRNLRSRALQDFTGCPGDEESFEFRINKKNCNYGNFRNAINSKKGGTCAIDTTANPDAIALNLLGASNVEDAKDAVKVLCQAAYDATDVSNLFNFSDITKRGHEFDNEYYSGGTYYNYEVQTNDGQHELKTDAARVRRIKEDEAETKIIDLPTYLPSFDPNQDGCDIDAAYCCWVQDRQAGDNNGNCNTPYDSQCIDKDPADNANFCYTDHNRSQPASHVTGGFSIFGDIVNNKENIEGPIHCHGFAWANDTTHESSVYKGNNLFFVSLFDHMHERGYVRNAPGSSMCGCAENMAVVTRADCTEIDAKEIFDFTYDKNTTSFSGVLTAIDDINFNACQGTDANGNNDNNDLESYYRRLVNEGKQPQENLETLQKSLVGDQAGQCNAAIKDFMRTKGIITKEEAAASGAVAADMAMEGAVMADSMIIASSEKNSDEVEYLDPVYAYEVSSHEKDGMMPDVPTSHETDADAEEDTPTAPEAAAVAIIEDEDEMAPAYTEDEAPEQEEDPAPLEIDVDGRVNDDPTDTTTDETPTSSPVASPVDVPVAVAAPMSSPTAAPTSSPTSDPTASPTASPTAGPTSSPTTKDTGSVGDLDYWVSCGNTNKCGKPSPDVRSAKPDDTYGVRCCSEADLGNGWIKRQENGCTVWGDSPGCQHKSKTYDEAKAICSSVGARLCTTDELVNQCTRGTGCGFDRQLMWAAACLASGKGTCNHSSECCSGECLSTGICK